MPVRPLTDAEQALVEPLIRIHADAENQRRLKFLHDILSSLFGESEALGRLAHSFKSRMKDAASLRDKLQRQLVRDVDERKVPFHINQENFFTEINDLVGYRILHLYTRQMREIDIEIRRLLAEASFDLLAGYPKAKVWDDESRRYFEEIGITTEGQPRMYSSVHYVIASSSRVRLTAEIQVRTLAQELWGEVDHQLNYPQPCESVSLREQIRALAWVASSCTRLVDSIFTTQASNAKDSPTARPDRGADAQTGPENPLIKR